LRLATPDQFHLDQGLWIIPPEVVKQLQMDMRRKRQQAKDIPPYIVPLSVQAMEVVRYMLEHFKPAQRYLFRHDFDLKKRMSENTLNTALKRMGYRDLLTGHGIRATMSTALNEFGYPKAWVDAQLSHVDPNKVSATYNHAEYVEQRRRMMQDWADRLNLFEQNMVEVASMPLTIHLEGGPAIANEQATNGPPTRTATTSPILLVTKPGDAMPLVSAATHRLSAVALPQPAVPTPLSDVQRERMELIEVFESPHNLLVAAYAKMAGKSRRWISYEIKAGNLLALNVGNRGQRVPDWHLDPNKHALIQAVMKLRDEVEPRRRPLADLPRAVAAAPDAGSSLSHRSRHREQSRQGHHGRIDRREGKRMDASAGGVAARATESPRSTPRSPARVRPDGRRRQKKRSRDRSGVGTN